jgi:hypothetical protein
MNIIFPRTTESVSIAGVTIEAASAGTLQAEWVEVTAAGATVIPDSAGAFKVEVINVGGLVEGTDFAAIDVNGDTVQSGGQWEAPTFMDYTTSPSTQYFTGTVTVTNASNSAFRYRVTRPA